MGSIRRPELFARLDGADRVLVAGAGGGFDLVAALPVALALTSAGAEVQLVGLSFSGLEDVPPHAWVAPGLALVGAGTPGATVFRERTLAQWLLSRDLRMPVHVCPRSGVVPTRAAYAALVERFAPDAIVLVDGGTDILLRGDEAGLGTPHEDMTSLSAVAGLRGPADRFVVSIGFGIDAHHGVCHAHVLENIAALEQAGAYLGAFSVSPASAEGRAYLDAVAHVQAAARSHPSIVNGQVAAAIAGEFGDIRFTTRTSGSELFVNPLMALCFAFDLVGVANSVHYLHLLEATTTAAEVDHAIATYRRGLADVRPWRALPH